MAVYSISAVTICSLGILAISGLPRGTDPGSEPVSISWTVANARRTTHHVAIAAVQPQPSSEAIASPRPEVEKPTLPAETKPYPLAGLIAQIKLGREMFLREWTSDDPRSHGGDGLGPVFNDSSCVACHNLGGIGGGGPNGKNVDILTLKSRHFAQTSTGKETAASVEEASKIHPAFPAVTSVVLHRFGTAPDYVKWRLERLMLAAGTLASVNLEGLGKNPSQSLAVMEVTQSRMAGRKLGPRRSSPARGLGVTRSQRNPTALFGAGLIDSIPERALEERSATRFDRFPHIRGRLSRLDDGRIGRFGWKAQVPSLTEFVLTACAVELGLEVPFHRQGGDPLVPNLTAQGLDLNLDECLSLTMFVRSLPAPGRQTPTAGEESVAIRTGNMLFQSVGCATCHAPELGGISGIYSDLLLHDMGPDGSDTGSYRVFRPEPSSPGLTPSGPLVNQSGAPPGATNLGANEREWRTPPLWGLRDSGPYLHDGRAETLEQAIALHGGEGEEPKQKYFALSPQRRQQVQAFLKSLVAPASKS